MRHEKDTSLVTQHKLPEWYPAVMGESIHIFSIRFHLIGSQVISKLDIAFKIVE